MSGSGTPGYSAWLAGLKVGDEVLVDGAICKITGDTPKRWRFSRHGIEKQADKSTGRAHGINEGFRVWLEPLADAKRAAILADRRAKMLKDWARYGAERDITRLPLSAIERVKALVDAEAAAHAATKSVA